MDLVEFDELQHAFRGKALENRDVAAGTLLIKIPKRRAAVLGLNPPIGYAVAMVQHAPPESRLRLKKLRAAIDPKLAPL